MTKKERRNKYLGQHYTALSALAASLGAKNCDGKRLSCKLLAIESSAHHAAEQWANGEINENDYDDKTRPLENEVSLLFNGNLPTGFFINSDPRGEALKIDDEVTKQLHAQGIYLQRDMGGYGLLAPTITGD